MERALAAALEGAPVVGEPDPAFLLLSTDEDGHPFVCLLSRRQLAVRGEGLVALVASLRSTANLAARPSAAVHLIAGGAAIYARCRAASLRPTPYGALVELEVLDVESDSRAPSLEPPSYVPTEELLAFEGPSVQEVLEGA